MSDQFSYLAGTNFPIDASSGFAGSGGGVFDGTFTSLGVPTSTLLPTPNHQTRVCPALPTQASYHTDSLIPTRGETGRSKEAGDEVGGKAGHRTSSASNRCQILQSSVPGTEDHRRVQAGDRLVASDPLHKSTSISDGNSGLDQGSTTGQLLGRDYRPDRCLFSYPNTQGGKALPQIYDRGSGLAVQSPSLWADLGALPIHVDATTTSQGAERSRSQNSHVPGRLDCAPSGLFSAQDSYRMGSAVSCFHGFQSEQREVENSTDTTFHLFGNGVRPVSTDRFSSRGQMPTDCRPNFDDPRKSSGVNCKDVGTSPRKDCLCRDLGPPREATLERIANALVRTLELRLEKQRGSDSRDTSNSSSSQLVVRQNSPSDRSLPDKSSVPGNAIDGCEFNRMGSAPGEPSGVRSMEHTGTSSTYQLTGAQGSDQCITGLQILPDRQVHSDSHRQFNSIELSEKSRGHQKQAVSEVNTAVLQISGTDEGTVQMPPHTREEESTSGSTVKERTSNPSRVDSQSRSAGRAVGKVGKTKHRCVRHMSKPSSSSVLLTGTRSKGRSHSSNGSRLDTGSPVHVSSNVPDSSSAKKTQASSSQSGLNSSMVGKRKVVSRPSTNHELSRGGAHQSRSRSRHLVSTTSRRTVSQSKGTFADRIFVTKYVLKKRGSSSRVIDLVLRKYVRNTGKLYDQFWKRFYLWCQAQRPPIKVLQILPEQLEEFYAYLSLDLHLSAGSVMNHRSALHSVFRYIPRNDLMSDPVIQAEFQGMKRPGKPSMALPKWSLPLVLRMLMRKPFEPIGMIPMDLLTYKTAFLITLASRCRRSELHAVDRHNLQFHSEWEFVDLPLLSDFWAKFQAKDEHPEEGRCLHLDPLFSKAQKQRGLSHEEQNQELLCPVRALRCYFRRSQAELKAKGKTARRLLLPLTDRVNDVCANTVSGWIKKTIKMAYERATQEDLNACQVPAEEPDFFRAAHEVRALGASLAWHKGNMSLRTLLKSCHWRSHTVFTKCYLRDLSSGDDQQGYGFATRFLPSSSSQR